MKGQFRCCVSSLDGADTPNSSSTAVPESSSIWGRKVHNSRVDLATYYSKRAAEYEAIYQKPERQSDLRELEHLLQEDLRGRDILEIACGTGYWTERVAPIANSIFALDINESVLQIAREKRIGGGSVEF